MSVVHRAKDASADSDYYILWKDLPRMIRMIRRHGGKVTPDVARHLVQKGLMHRTS